MSERKLLHESRDRARDRQGARNEARPGPAHRADGGRQCADFNCFNLHDYKEFFHTGRTRHLHGLHPTKGDFLWSAPPRERPMMAIIDDTAGTNDVLYPRCSGYLFEYHYGLPVHTNCHDIQAEAQREYGLTPDDVHDSFNFFMHTGVDTHGRPFIAENTATQGRLRRAARADRRARRAQCLRRGRHDDEQLRAQAAQAHRVRGIRR